MSRIVLVGSDLSGQVLNASTQPDGHARESLIQGCTFDAATRFLGDWRGTDYIGGGGAADWSQAQTYGSLWRCNVLGAAFPPDIGHLHHQPVAEIIRQRIVALNPTTTLRNKLEAVRLHVLGGGSWDTSKLSWWDGLTQTQRNRLRDLWRQVFQGYPGLAERFEGLLKSLLAGEPLYTGTRQEVASVTWPDGAQVTVDAGNLPTLPEKSRYALRQWIEAQNPDGIILPEGAAERHCFVYAVADALSPITVIQPLREADSWLVGPGGF